jgi:hypothetical protein
MLRTSSVNAAGNAAVAVSRITCRTRSVAVSGVALRLTITISAQDGWATSARTTAAPTWPVPPMMTTRNAIGSLNSNPSHAYKIDIIRIRSKSHGRRVIPGKLGREGSVDP